MSTAFLDSVLPKEGYLIVATPTTRTIDGKQRTSWFNKVVPDVPAFIAQCIDWTWEGKDVFYAMASFREPRIWNAKKANERTGETGMWERRSQANVKSMRSLYLDLDVKADDAKKYASQGAALTALRAFCGVLRLPKPTLVNSGYGLHVYWMLDADATREQWKPVAEKLKSVCTAFGLLTDSNITADEARVLRVPGTYNCKRQMMRPVLLLSSSLPTTLTHLDAMLSSYIDDNGIPVAPRRVLTPPSTAPSLIGIEDNIGATNDPLNPDLLTFACPAFCAQVAARGATASEPQWYTTLGLAKFCDPQAETLLAVSDGHPGFDPVAMQHKLANWTGGPPTCAKFWHEDNDTCEACPNWQKIKSPAVLGRMLRPAAPLPVSPTLTTPNVVPAPPGEYVRAKGKHDETIIAVITSNEDGIPSKEIICPYDFYPKRVLRQTNEDDVVEESSIWTVHLPRMGEVEIKLPQSILSDTRKLHAFLLARGMHINANEAKSTQFYMTAYIKELTRLADREKMYERLGWHEKYHAFVLPNRIYFRDGTTMVHQPSMELKAITKEAIHTQGTLPAWMQAMGFYLGTGNEPYRIFVYASFGAFLLHMTGHKGVLLAASGTTGQGKTTMLEACGSIWGDPEPLLVSGGRSGTTVNALYHITGTYHSLPLLWDDTTERDPTEMREFMLHISTGKGKERMLGNAHDGKVMTWETMVLSSANTDDVHRVMASGKDTDPHLMRMISVEFDNADRGSAMKIKADHFKRAIRENYGHAGPILVAYVVRNYEAVREMVLKEMERIDRKIKAQSQERFWTAAIASMLVAARIAFQLGVSPFNPDDDIDWIVNKVTHMRVMQSQATSTPADMLDEFLNAHVSNTLTLSPKAASNIDNIISRPHGTGGLVIRNEVDTGRVFVARNAITEYCIEHKANFRKLEAELMACDIVVRRNCHKVLGADTPFAMGQTRCWEVDIEKLRELTGKKT